MAVPSRVSLQIRRLVSGAETSPSTLVDSSGNGHTLTKNGVTDRVSVQAKYAQGYDFPANAAYHLTNGDAALRITGDMVLFVAAEIDNVNNDQTLVAHDGADGTSNSNRLYGLRVLTGGKVEFTHDDGTRNSILFTTHDSITAGFHTFRIVRTGANRIQMYVDGVLKDHTNPFGSTIPTGGSGGTCKIGRQTLSDGTTNQPLDGGVFEVRVWDMTTNGAVPDDVLEAIEDPTDGGYAGTPEGTEVACWFFGTFPSQTTDLEEDLDVRGGRVLGVSLDRPQSVGNQSAQLRFRNRGGKFNDWASVQVVSIRAKRPYDNAYSLLLEGVTDEPLFPGGLQPEFSCRVAGLNSLLDTTTVDEDTSFQDTAYTTIFNDLAKRWFPGYTRVITSDAAFPANVTFQAGMKLRDALDWCRRALIAKTGSKWELEVRRDGDTKQLVLYKRSTSVTRTLGLKDLIGVPVRYPGSMSDIVNKAKVYGAQGPSSVVDRTPPRVAVSQVETAFSNKRLASPFVAQAGGLTAWAPYIGRDTYRTNPTITGFISRNSDNLDIIGLGMNRRATVLNDDSPKFTAHGNFDDDDNTTSANFTTESDNVYRTAVKYDFGATPVAVQLIRFAVDAVTGSDSWQVEWSNDNSAWTTAATYNDPSGLQTTLLASDERHRYWRLRYKNNSAASAVIKTFQLQRFKNKASTGPTNPDECTDNDWSTTGLTMNTAAPSQTIMFQGYVDTSGANDIMNVAKIVVRHSETQAAGAGGVEVYVLAATKDGREPTLAVLPGSASMVTDTVFLKKTQGLLSVTLLCSDTRGSGPTNTTTVRLFQVYEETTTQNQPLNGDQLGGTVSWSAGDHHPPAETDENLSNTELADLRAFDPTQVSMTVGNTYWYVIEAPTLVTYEGYWFPKYSGTGIAGASCLVQTVGATTWAETHSPARLLMAKLEFGEGRLTGAKSDVTSQLRYAGIIPHGHLVGALSDEVLDTQSMVDDEATVLLDVRKDPRDRIGLTIPGDVTVDVGNRVTLDQELCYSIGLTGPQTYDCVGERHGIDGGGWVKHLTLNDHPPGGGQGLRLVASVATGGTL